MSKPRIKIRYTSIDGHHETRTFETLTGAHRYAAKWVGDHPDKGSRYAISDDGVGKITCEGCSLADLFPSQEATLTAADRLWKEQGRDRRTAEA